ncbi:unnamed protein product [Arctia plantaginis]|uniref:Chitin-binding type-2 domain-containing protein n=1 Tax=Arctia plantaginis TaxID=874455 RepID=A0A8S1AH44_ARCPL|nr:unnamed protein product [Arctia plantaginis]CAB3260705.1 unnamed protein product [Arctia plantaginis]
MKGAIFSVLFVAVLVNGAAAAGNDDPSQAPRICAATNATNILVAHENCNQFYKCLNGVPTTKSCPSDLLFDPSKNRCEWPSSVNCGNRIIPVRDESQGAAVVCALPGADNSFVAHEFCDKFYKCFEGRPVAFSCGFGTLWNAQGQYCDYARNVDCGNRNISSINVPQFPVGNNHDDPSLAPQICAAANSANVHNNSCKETHKSKEEHVMKDHGNVNFDPPAKMPLKDKTTGIIHTITVISFTSTCRIHQEDYF